jgi:hypothetical protein
MAHITCPVVNVSCVSGRHKMLVVKVGTSVHPVIPTIFLTHLPCQPAYFVLCTLLVLTFVEVLL